MASPLGYVAWFYNGFKILSFQHGMEKDDLAVQGQGDTSLPVTD